jgi:hypothetical protein
MLGHWEQTERGRSGRRGRLNVFGSGLGVDDQVAEFSFSSISAAITNGIRPKLIPHESSAPINEKAH